MMPTGFETTMSRSESLDCSSTLTMWLLPKVQGPEKLLTFLQAKTSQKANLPNKTIESGHGLGVAWALLGRGIGVSVVFRGPSSG